MTGQPEPADVAETIRVLQQQLATAIDAVKRLDREVTELRAALAEPGPTTTQTTGHVYLSTGCYHGDHAYCQSMTGLNGAKRPGVCKFCQAACQCECHGEAEQPGPLTRAEEARLAQDGVDTPGCNCGHDGMGVSWHGDDCLWRRSVVDCPGRPTPG